ncbi:hypothetical protein SAMN06296056_102822 [Priestia filamentosa]|nr:hypothetical protein SAMN06296056_102822 [Priestia filamentosa]
MCNQHTNTTPTRVLSVANAKAPFETTTIERRALRPDDVLIDIKFSGICHSDIHSAFDEWGGGMFPMVPEREENLDITRFVRGLIAKRPHSDHIWLKTRDFPRGLSLIHRISERSFLLNLLSYEHRCS